jgi:hypothetical protein
VILRLFVIVGQKPESEWRAILQIRTPVFQPGTRGKRA